MSYGQYSENSVGRLTLPEIVPYGARDARKAGHNRATYTDRDGVRRFRLIGTDVVTYDPATRTIDVFTGGYNTMTTRAAISQGFVALGLLATRAEGWRDPDGKPAKYPPAHPAPDGWEFRPVIKSGVFPDTWGASAWGHTKKKGERGNGFALGPNGGFSGEGNPIRAHFLRSLTMQIDDNGAPHLIAIDGEPCEISRAA